MFLLVGKFQWQELLKVVHVQSQRSQQKHLKKKSNGLHKHCILLCEDDIYKL